MGVAHEYAAAVLNRGRQPLEEDDREADWDDLPWEGKFYPTAERFPLPVQQPLPPGATTQHGLFGPGGTGGFTLPLLGDMLQDSYGLSGRRLGVHANVNLSILPDYTTAHWGRCTASGGGLYPVTVYWASGAAGPLLPGVYHYSAQHHALQRLLSGDVSAEVRAAVGDDRLTEGTDQFLILGVKFWLNTFKYANFGFHVVPMDVGALLQTWRIWARAQGLQLGEALWFDEPRLGRLLGLQEEHEGVFAVVPLRWDRDAATAPAPAAPALRVRTPERERSSSFRTFDLVRRMQAATLVDATRRPVLPAVPPPPAVGGAATPLPAPLPLPTPLRTALRARRSSFGRFSAQRPLGADVLAAVLAAAESAGAGLTRQYVFVNKVEGVSPGLYAYASAGTGPEDGGADGGVGGGGGSVLRLLKAGPPGAFLQRTYTLHNYNLQQAGAVIVPAVQVDALLDAVGDRGYRLSAATVGATAQAVYTAAAAAGIGCGVALAFDGVAYAEELGTTATGELPMMLMAVGPERPDPADYHYEVA